MTDEGEATKDRRVIDAELRRLAFAAAFFAGCVLVIAALALVGLYH